MPKIPQQETFTVAPSVQPNVALRAPEMGNQPAQQLQQSGDALMRVGQATAQITNVYQLQANQAIGAQARAKGNDAATATRLEGLSQKGENALKPDENGLSLVDRQDAKLKQQLDAIRADLGNDVQRAQFDEFAAAQRAQQRAALSGHVIQQQDAFFNETADANIKSLQDSGALLYGDPKQVQRSLDGIARVINGGVDPEKPDAVPTIGLAQRNGWSPEIAAEKLKEARSPMDVQIMKNMILGGRATDAKAYYDTHSAGMTMQAQAQMQGVLADAVDSQAATAAVGKVWDAAGPKGPNDPVKFYDLEQALAADPSLKDNPRALTMATTIFRQRAQAFNAQQAEVNAGNVNGVYKLYDSGAPLAQIMRTDAWLSLPGAKQHEIIKGIEAENAVRAQRQLSEEQKQLTALQVHDHLQFMKNAGDYLKDMNPDSLANKSRAEVEAMRAKYGVDRTNELLNRWDQISNSNRKNAANITDIKLKDDELETAARKAGLLGTGQTIDKLSGEDADKFVAFRDRIMARVNDYEQNGPPQGKRKATAEEVRKQIDAELMDKAFVPGWFGSPKQVRSGSIDKTNAGSAFVLVGNQKVRLADIPPDVRVQASRELVARGLPVTDQKIAEMWMWQQSQGAGK